MKLLLTFFMSAMIFSFIFCEVNPSSVDPETGKVEHPDTALMTKKVMLRKLETWFTKYSFPIDGKYIADEFVTGGFDSETWEPAVVFADFYVLSDEWWSKIDPQDSLLVGLEQQRGIYFRFWHVNSVSNHPTLINDQVLRIQAIVENDKLEGTQDLFFLVWVSEFFKAFSEESEIKAVYDILDAGAPIDLDNPIEIAQAGRNSFWLFAGANEKPDGQKQLIVSISIVRN